jgi:hypothetical protein
VVSNFSKFSIIVDTKALPQLTQVGRAVALALTHGRPLGDVPEQLEDRLCHILVQPKPRTVHTKERQTSLFDDHIGGRCEHVQALVGGEMIPANA